MLPLLRQALEAARPRPAAAFAYGSWTVALRPEPSEENHLARVRPAAREE